MEASKTEEGFDISLIQKNLTDAEDCAMLDIEQYRKISLALIEMKENATTQNEKDLLSERLMEVQMKIAGLRNK